MSAARFDLSSLWRLAGATRDEVWEVLTDARGFTRWWSDVYLDVDVLDEGDADGVGAVLAVHTRGWLPYHLRWRARVVDVRRPETLALDASGDLAGHGRWILTQAGPDVIALRLVRRRRAAAVTPARAAAQAGIRRQPPLGDGAGRGRVRRELSARRGT